jgi:hypothetical protein
MNCRQLTIPFFPPALSPGTTLYYCKYTKRYYEQCQGRLIFEMGQKVSCRECAASCVGCLEQAINLGFTTIEAVGRLVGDPHRLNPKFQKQLWQQLQKKSTSPKSAS